MFRLHGLTNQQYVNCISSLLECFKYTHTHTHTHTHMQSTSDAPQVPDHIKFLVVSNYLHPVVCVCVCVCVSQVCMYVCLCIVQFQGIADQLFQSFNSSISVTSFDTLSSCIISWLEEYCKPQVCHHKWSRSQTDRHSPGSVSGGMNTI